MEHHVTVGVDGSPESRAAARWAAREAVLRQVPLRLVHAVDWPLDPVFPGLGRQDVDRWADQALSEAARELHGRHRNLEITTRCLTARPAAALAAEAADAGLLVLGSRGLGGLVGFIVGSVAMSTVVATDTPVVLVRVADDPDGPGTDSGAEIVVGVDIHEACDRVLVFAFEEAARRDCPLRAVHGWEMPAAYSYVPFFDPDNERDIGRSVTHMVDDMLLPWRHKFPDVNVSHDVFMGSAGGHLVRASRGAGLVVVGRRVRRSPLGAHLGAVAHAVLHHAAAPVAVVSHD
ncbi:Universal stress protein [Streptomyces lavendulae subsp. lavendulae]|uniref:Universal stress protein n=1 Tax=Streptomyces lavendulae subsp. lavendulae TaxID=58340 RepID=A0A2K8P975_STRLA|nr:universal stress protein [Streptomyces lavendulae]ATZ23297.1 Universal stress protein [Streptomyces lavendulae subsp. lavendulae]QUQ53128.1 Universal stress protein [Streptomyces lavendulae subsp. lavendulae]